MSLTNVCWGTHDFKVRMLDWSAARGSRLAFTCRHCGRRFCQFTLLSQAAWAVDSEGKALESTVSTRWLGEACPHLFNLKDDDDRKLLRKT